MSGVFFGGGLLSSWLTHQTSLSLFVAINQNGGLGPPRSLCYAQLRRWGVDLHAPL